MNPLPLSRSRLIQASAEMRDMADARDWLIAIVATSLVIGLALIASAIVQVFP